MPSGKQAPPGKRQPVVDFDRVANIAQRAIDAEKLEAVRAKVDASGAFVHREMLERLATASDFGGTYKAQMSKVLREAASAHRAFEARGESPTRQARQ